MKILNLVLMAVLSLSLVTPPARASVGNTAIDPVTYLKQQQAELLDLKAQINAAKEKKHTAKVILAISATALVGGMIATKLAADARGFEQAWANDFRVNQVQHSGITVLTVGKVTTGVGALGVVTNALIIHMSNAEIKILETQIDELQAEINSLMIQIIENKK